MDVQDKDILCVGLCVLDVIHVCSSYPAEDVDMRSKTGRWQRGGNASNICTVLRQLGASCEFIGPLPNTKMFQFVIEDALDRGIKISHCPQHTNCQEPVSSVLLNDATGSRTIVFSSGNVPILTFEDFQKVDLSAYKWIHFEARNREETLKMINSIDQWNSTPTNQQITISVEFEKPIQENLQLAAKADVVFVGKDFAIHLGYTKESVVYEAAKWAKPTSMIICPWGSEGAVALDVATGDFSTTPVCPPNRVVDSLGAGDTFAAATIYSLNRQRNLTIAIEFGCRVAGAKCGFYGYDGIDELFASTTQFNVQIC